MFSRYFMDIDADSLNDPIAVVGLPGIGAVGKISVETLRQVLDARHIADFFSKYFPPKILVRNGKSHFPRSSMHLYRSAPDEGHDLIILTADFQPQSEGGVLEYADYVIQEFTKMGVSRVYALAAYEQEYKNFFAHYPNPPRIFASASSNTLLDEIMELPGAVATENGVITGANGVIPSWGATMYDMEGACLLGETLGVVKLDYRSSKALVERFSDLVGLKADFSILEEKAKRVEELIEWAEEELSQREISSGEMDERPPDRYIG
ncbi:MAG: PAC2 family protein [Candidatus Thorarchaeota archaeon]|nr:PAC2 family protein [Candidatus Thorarchaeota archaeon]